MTEMDRLVQDLSASPDLQEKLLKQQDGLQPAVTAAREAGYAITTEEAVAYLNTLQDSSQKELSDAQLDSVAGGKKRANFSVLFADDPTVQYATAGLFDGDNWKALFR
jgi:predicted ribosomally synthesized peptide with nif11-like leader